LGFKSLFDLGTLRKVSEEYPKILTNISIASWCSQFLTKPKSKLLKENLEDDKEEKRKIRRRSEKNFKVERHQKNQPFTSNLMLF